MLFLEPPDLFGLIEATSNRTGALVVVSACGLASVCVDLSNTRTTGTASLNHPAVVSGDFREKQRERGRPLIMVRTRC